jgi:hypothetical protein
MLHCETDFTFAKSFRPKDPEMSKQLTLSSVIAIFAMMALALTNTAHPVADGASDGATQVQAKVPQIDRDALGLLSPGYSPN